MLMCCFGSALLASGAAYAGDAVQVHDGWFRYLLPTIPAGGYMTLMNTSGTPAVLTSAVSPACQSMMLHRTESSGGVERMVGVANVTVPAHGTFKFSPGGYHVMCMQPKMHVGEHIAVTLHFADGSQVNAPFTVHAANGSSHAAMPMKMGQ
jgi:hypothetical protein